ncbi:MAG: nucleoside triphosphate pyrophosphohydrolase [Myxococcales bacterium]|nr:nucleoside triphosphate pyrophosphohydrolase [Myxococcales bacterium]
MACLRGPDGGCPWDRTQTLESLRAFLIEESHELLDAIDALGGAARLLPADLPQAPAEVPTAAVAQFREELGDVLLQVVFESRIAEEAGWFGAADVARGIADKMIRRHPHVFAGAATGSPQDVVDRWEQQKRSEGKGALDGVPRQMPALLRAQRIAEKAARIGFDWPDRAGVLAKIDEETAELHEAMAAGDPGRIADEFGDVLFAWSNLARHLGVDGEQALRRTLDRFQSRFAHVEKQADAAYGRAHRASLAELDGWWNEAKRLERAGELPDAAPTPTP